jgi:hypothetical protein
LSYIVEGMKLWRTVVNHLFPWRGKTHRPHILRRGWLVAFLAVALVSEGILLSHTLVPGGPNVFLAAVLRSDVIEYTIDARESEGGHALIENEALNAAAQAKAEDMAARGYFSHKGPDGEEPWVWIDRAGYEYVYAGENLAVRFNDSRDVVDAWMASPTHRANIVKANYQEIGVGLAQGTYKGGPATFVVQYFGSPKTPVATAPLVPERTVPAAVQAAPAVAVAVANAPVAQSASVAEQSQVAAEAPLPQSAVAGIETQSAAVQSAVSAPKQSFTQSATRAITEAISDAPKGASWVLAGIAMLLITVLALTFFIRIQVQPTDLLLPGLAVALIAVTLIGVNAKFLPQATQSASVVLSGTGDIGEGVSIERVSAFPETQAQ